MSYFVFLPFRICSKASDILDQNTWLLVARLPLFSPSFFPLSPHIGIHNHEGMLIITFDVCSRNFIFRGFEFQHGRALSSPKLPLQTLSFPLAQPRLFRKSVSTLNKMMDLGGKVHPLIPLG